jgi:hypothetical protein
MTERQSGKSAVKWAFLSFLLGCVICIILRATEVMPRPQIVGNIAQQGGADIGLILAFGIVFGLVGFVAAKLKG